MALLDSPIDRKMEGLLTDMTERWMTQIVREARGFDKVWVWWDHLPRLTGGLHVVAAQSFRKSPAELRNLE
jgi:hypothetical protein